MDVEEGGLACFGEYFDSAEAAATSTQTGDCRDRQISSLQKSAILALFEDLRTSVIHKYIPGLEEALSEYVNEVDDECDVTASDRDVVTMDADKIGQSAQSSDSEETSQHSPRFADGAPRTDAPCSASGPAPDGHQARNSTSISQRRIRKMYWQSRQRQTSTSSEKSQRHSHTPLLPPSDLIPLPAKISLPDISLYEANDAVLKDIRKQIGRIPSGLLGVGKFNKITGEASVLVVSPVVDGGPFPTCYWLTDRRISNIIGGLEGVGYIKQLESEFDSGERNVEELVSDNILYMRRRLSLMSTAMAEALQGRGGAKAAAALLRRGIGGIVDFRRVRCLHMHYAMHLMEPQGSVVGRILEEKEPSLREVAVA